MKVAICVPAYNNPTILDRLLQSIFRQTFNDYIVVITDDSNNSSVRDYVSGIKDNRIIYSVNEKSLGATANNNRAIKIARKYNPEYIKIMHHDDEFSDKTSLERMVSEMDKNPSSNMMMSIQTDVYTNKRSEWKMPEKIYKEIITNPYYIFLRNWIGVPSVVMFRNNEDFLFDEELTWNVDWELYMRILLKNPHLLCIYDPLVNVYQSTTQLSNECMQDLEMRLREACYIYGKYDYLRNNPLGLDRLRSELLRITESISDIRKVKELVNSQEHKEYLMPVYEQIYNLVKSVRKKKIVICGAGLRFENFKQVLISSDFTIKCVVDKRIEETCIKDSLLFVPYQELKQVDYDYVIITSEMNYEEIAAELINEIGVHTKKILPVDMIMMCRFVN